MQAFELGVELVRKLVASSALVEDINDRDLADRHAVQRHEALALFLVKIVAEDLDDLECGSLDLVQSRRWNIRAGKSTLQPVCDLRVVYAELRRNFRSDDVHSGASKQ